MISPAEDGSNVFRSQKIQRLATATTLPTVRTLDTSTHFVAVPPPAKTSLTPVGCLSLAPSFYLFCIMDVFWRTYHNDVGKYRETGMAARSRSAGKGCKDG